MSTSTESPSDPKSPSSDTPPPHDPLPSSSSSSVVTVHHISKPGFMILPPELLDAIAARLDRQSALALLTVSKEEKVKKAALSRIWRCVDVTTQQDDSTPSNSELIQRKALFLLDRLKANPALLGYVFEVVVDISHTTSEPVFELLELVRRRGITLSLVYSEGNGTTLFEAVPSHRVLRGLIPFFGRKSSFTRFRAQVASLGLIVLPDLLEYLPHLVELHIEMWDSVIRPASLVKRRLCLSPAIRQLSITNASSNILQMLSPAFKDNQVSDSCELYAMDSDLDLHSILPLLSSASSLQTLCTNARYGKRSSVSVDPTEVPPALRTLAIVGQIGSHADQALPIPEGLPNFGQLQAIITVWKSHQVRSFAHSHIGMKVGSHSIKLIPLRSVSTILWQESLTTVIWTNGDDVEAPLGNGTRCPTIYGPFTSIGGIKTARHASEWGEAGIRGLIIRTFLRPDHEIYEGMIHCRVLASKHGAKVGHQPSSKAVWKHYKWHRNRVVPLHILQKVYAISSPPLDIDFMDGARNMDLPSSGWDVLNEWIDSRPKVNHDSWKIYLYLTMHKKLSGWRTKTVKGTVSRE